MACVVELSAAGVDYADEVNDPTVLEATHSVQIGSRLDIESGGIPTFDASDVDNQLEKSRSERLLGKCLIILASYNPLPLLRVALVRAHTSERDKTTDKPYRKRLSAMDITHTHEDALWNLEGQLSSDAGQQQVPRRDLLVTHLSSSIQREFRHRVLQMLLLYVAAITIVVVASLLCIPWASVQSLMDQSPYLLPVAQAGVTAVVVLSLWLVYALRFDTPINYAALTFLTVGEAACLVAHGVMHGPHAVVQTLSLLLCGVVLLRAFAGRSVSHSDDELLCPAQAAMRSAAVLALVAVPLNAVIGEAVTHTTTSSLLGLLGFVTLALLWVSLVLTVLTQTMTTEEYAAALVFFQADLVVLGIVEPAHVALKYLILWKRSLHKRASENEDALSPRSRSQPNVVVPAFWPDQKKTNETSVRVAAVTSRTSPRETPLYPTHLIPRRPRVHSGASNDDTPPVETTAPAPSPSTSEVSLNHAAGPRRRNSTADE